MQCLSVEISLSHDQVWYPNALLLSMVEYASIIQRNAVVITFYDIVLVVLPTCKFYTFVFDQPEDSGVLGVGRPLSGVFWYEPSALFFFSGGITPKSFSSPKWQKTWPMVLPR